MSSKRKRLRELEDARAEVMTHRQTFGSDDPRTIRSETLLADHLRELGQFEAALIVLQSAYEAELRTLGEADWETLKTSHEIAWLKYRLGELEEARDRQATTLRLFQENFDDENEGAAAVMVNLSTTLEALHDYEALAELNDDLVRVMSAIYGPAHPKTMQALSQSARTFRKLGKTQQAKDIERSMMRSASANLRKRK